MNPQIKWLKNIYEFNKKVEFSFENSTD